MSIQVVRFKAIRGESCKGCLLEHERSTACRTFTQAAVRAGLPDCDTEVPGAPKYIYVADEVDERQMDLLEETN